MIEHRASAPRRELEFAPGVRDERFAARFRALTGDERQRVRRLAGPPLRDACLALLAARGLAAGDDEEILASLRTAACDRAACDGLWQLAGDLLTHGELAVLRRARHVAMVERQTGTRSGTGGPAGAPYLRGRVHLRYYPLLWELRDRL